MKRKILIMLLVFAQVFTLVGTNVSAKEYEEETTTFEPGKASEEDTSMPVTENEEPREPLATYDEVVDLFSSLPDVASVNEINDQKAKEEIAEKVASASAAFSSLEFNDRAKIEKVQPQLIEKANQIKEVVEPYAVSNGYKIAEVDFGSGWVSYYDNITLSHVWNLAVSNPNNAQVKIKLFNNWYPSNYIDLPANKLIKIDLNGYTIDRRATSASSSGMVFYVRDGATLDIDDTSSRKDGKITGGYATGYGGGIHMLSNSKVTLINGNIVGNKSYYGGGIYLYGNKDTKFTMEGGTIANNIAESTKYGGGGLYIGNGVVEIKGGSINKNRASYGGGIYLDGVVDGDSIIFSGGDISSNYAEYDGGGVYIDDGTVTLNGDFRNNIAKRSGGGVFANRIRTDNNEIVAFKIDKAFFDNNSAENGNGGGICFNDNTGQYDARIAGGTFTRNRSSNKGGAVYARYNSRVILGSEKQTLIIQNNYPNNFYLPKGAKLRTVELSAIDTKVGIYTEDYSLDGEFEISEQKIKETAPTIKYISDRDAFEFRISDFTKLCIAKKQPTGTEVTEYNGKKLIKGIFSFAPKNYGADRTATYYYNDAFFTEGKDFSGKSTEYNPHLATMSCNLAMTAFGANMDYSLKYIYAETLLKDIGYSKIKYNKAMIEKPTKNSIGVITGYKYANHNNIIPIAIRGSQYESEWASNVTLGTDSDEAKGFSEAADQVMVFVDEYLKEQKLEMTNNIQFWVTGFSRSAAVANIVAKRLTDRYSSKDEYKVYAYCFETPQSAYQYNNKKTYDNIFNIVNPSDIVPRVAPKTMGFSRYGKSISIPGSQVGSTDYKAQKPKMLSQLGAVNPSVIFGDDFQEGTIQYITGGIGMTDFIKPTGNTLVFSDFADNFFKYFVEWTVKNRANYSQQIWGKSISVEDALSRVTPLPFTIPPERQSKIIKAAGGLVNRMGTLDMAWMYNVMVRWKDSNMVGDPTRQTAMDWLLTLILKNTQSEIDYNKSDSVKYPLPDTIGNHLTAQEYRDIEVALPTIIDLMFTFLSRDYWKNNQNYLGSLALNMDILVQPHKPEVALAWLRSYDSFYDNYESHKPAEEIEYVVPEPVTSAFPEKVYYSSQTVKLDCADPSATIVYTMDGSDPTTSLTAQNYNREPGKGGISLLGNKGQQTFYQIRAISRNRRMPSKPVDFIYTIDYRPFNIHLMDKDTGNQIRVNSYSVGEKVTYEAPIIKDKTFDNWTFKDDFGNDVTNSVLGIGNPKTSVVRFTMPELELFAIPSYTSKISEVSIQLETPSDDASTRKKSAEYNYKIDDTYYASSGWTGTSGSKNGIPASVKWKSNGTEEAGLYYTATINLLNDIKNDWYFTDNVKIKINGQDTTNITRNNDGSIVASMSFKPKTIDSTKVVLDKKTVRTGTAVADLKLPENVPMKLSFGPNSLNQPQYCERIVKINWDTSTYTGDVKDGDSVIQATFDFEGANIDDIQLGGIAKSAEMVIKAHTAYVAPAPTSSLESGVFPESKSVHLESTDKNVNIYYTTDDSDPSIDNGTRKLFDGTPIDILGGVEGSFTYTTIKATAVSKDPVLGIETFSDIVTFAYIVYIPKKLYKITIDCFDENPLVNKVAESISVYYRSGDNVYLSAPASEISFLEFVEWDPDNSDEGAAKDAIAVNPLQRTANFEMETKDITLRAKYLSTAAKINIEMEAPVAGEDLAMEVKDYNVQMGFAELNIPKDNVAVVWNHGGGKAMYGEEYSAFITIPSELEKQYKFTLQKDESVDITVNGERIPAESISFDSDSKDISITHTFPMLPKPKLKGVISPQPIGALPHGTLLEDIELPATVLIDVEGRSFQDSPVTWEIAPDATYNPQNLEQQTFKMNGTFSIPENVDLNGLSNIVPCFVDIQAAKVDVSAPTSSHKSGTYNESISVALSSNTPQAKILYTTDGSDPETNGVPYTTPIAITSFEDRDNIIDLKTIAVVNSISKSAISSFNYTIPATGKKSISITSPTENTIVNANIGDSAKLAITSEGDVERYQWEINTGNGFSNIVDATSNKYATPALMEVDNGNEYRCIAIGNDASIKATSYVFTIKINQESIDQAANGVTTSGLYANKKAAKVMNPVILNPTEEVEVSVELDKPADFAISALYAESYHWEVDRGDGFKVVANSNNPFYQVLKVTTEENDYKYRCVVTGADNTTSAVSPVFTLKVTDKASELKILSPTKDTTFKMDKGKKATLSITATGAVSYQWQKLKDGKYLNIDGATKTTFITQPFSATDNNSKYVCVVTGKDGKKLTSNKFILKSNDPLAIIEQFQNNVYFQVFTVIFIVMMITSITAFVTHRRKTRRNN